MIQYMAKGHKSYYGNFQVEEPVYQQNSGPLRILAAGHSLPDLDPVIH